MRRSWKCPTGPFSTLTASSCWPSTATGVSRRRPRRAPRWAARTAGLSRTRRRRPPRPRSKKRTQLLQSRNSRPLAQRQVARGHRRLHLGVLRETFGAELTADAGLFESAERRAGVELVHIDAVS